jgi:hypothetical protein
MEGTTDSKFVKHLGQQIEITAQVQFSPDRQVALTSIISNLPLPFWSSNYHFAFIPYNYPIVLHFIFPDFNNNIHD